MRTFNVLLILSIFLSGLSAQPLTCKEVSSARLGKTFLLRETVPLEETYIFIKKNSGKIIDSIKLPDPIDGYCFNAYHPVEQEFAVITDRYKFWILNLLNNECAGSFECIPRFESEDAQSGILDSYKISENGQYLFFHSRDHGPSCFSLKDLSNPIPLNYILPDNDIPSVPVLFYDLQENNSYILILASSSNFEWKVNYKIIAENIKLMQNDNNALDYHVSMQHYIVMNLINPETRCSNLIIDLKKGEILNYEKDYELINNVLKNINE